MNHKEFVATLSGKCEMSVKDTEKCISDLLSVMEDTLTSDKSISISGFGVLQVRKKMERVSVNPSSGQRMLIPPKLVLNYKPSALLKDKVK